MNRIDLNICFKLISIFLFLILLIFTWLKYKKVNKCKDKILFSFSIGIWRIIFSIFFLCLAIGYIIRLFESLLDLNEVINNIFGFLINIYFLIISRRKIFITKYGLAYNYYFSTFHIFMRWDAIATYFMFPPEKGHKSSLIIDYYNDKYKIKRLNLKCKKKDARKVENLFKEFIRK